MIVIFSVARLPLVLLSLLIMFTSSTVVIDQQQNQLQQQQQQQQRLLENNISESKQDNKEQDVSTDKKQQGKQKEEPKYMTRFPGDVKHEIKPEIPKKDDKPKSDEDEEEEEDPRDFYFYLFDEDSAVVEIEGPVNEDDKDEPPFLFNPKPGQIRIVEFYAQYVYFLNFFFQCKAVYLLFF